MGNNFPTARMRSIKMSGGIREILSRANELEGLGRDIIHMEIGRPDFDSPLCAKEAAIQALKNGDVHYTDMSGTMELRSALGNKYARDNAMEIDPTNQIVVTSGAIEALAATFLTLLEPEDELIIPTPYFAAYADQVAIAGGSVVEVPTTIENGFRVQIDNIKAALTNKTKAILINTPNNPSGAVLTYKDLEDIAKLAIDHDIWVISDECYEKFLYEGEHISIASLPGMAEKTITISAASKTWSMTGWRIGWAIVPAAIKPYITKCHQNLSTCANSFAQAGVAAAITEADDAISVMIDEYKRRRDMVISQLNQVKCFDVTIPSGAFYAFPKITRSGMSSMDMSQMLLEKAGVATVPGDVFGAPGHIRLAYCRSYDYLCEGLRRIRTLLS